MTEETINSVKNNPYGLQGLMDRVNPKLPSGVIKSNFMQL